MDRVCVLEHIGRERMPCLVNGSVLFLQVVHYNCGALKTHKYAVSSILEVDCMYRLLSSAHGEEGGLIDQVG